MYTHLAWNVSEWNKRVLAIVTGFVLLAGTCLLGVVAPERRCEASECSKRSSLLTQLQTLRSQLELYRVQHGEKYPTISELNADWIVMVHRTREDGAVDPVNGEFGPYSWEVPVMGLPCRGILRLRRKRRVRAQSESTIGVLMRTERQGGGRVFQVRSGVRRGKWWELERLNQC